jgi:hypothetical protein
VEGARPSEADRDLEVSVSDDRLIECLHGLRRRSKCKRCRRPIVWVLEIGGTVRKPTYRPFEPSSAPLDTIQRTNGVLVDRYKSDSFHRCPRKPLTRGRF